MLIIMIGPPCFLLKIYSVCVVCICPYTHLPEVNTGCLLLFPTLYIETGSLTEPEGSWRVRFKDLLTSASTPSVIGLLMHFYSQLLYGCWDSELTSLIVIDLYPLSISPALLSSRAIATLSQFFLVSTLWGLRKIHETVSHPRHQTMAPCAKPWCHL